MNIDWQEIRRQLAPGWSPTNIVVLVILFLFFRILAVAMLMYILFGDRIGLNLGNPATWPPAAGRFQRWVVGLTKSFGEKGPYNATGDTGTPDTSWKSSTQHADSIADEKAALAADRAKLDEEKAKFEAEKKAFQERRQRESDA